MACLFLQWLRPIDWNEIHVNQTLQVHNQPKENTFLTFSFSDIASWSLDLWSFLYAILATHFNKHAHIWGPAVDGHTEKTSGWCLPHFPGPHLHQSWRKKVPSPPSLDFRGNLLLTTAGLFVYWVEMWENGGKTSTFRNSYTASESWEPPFSISKPDWEVFPVV